MNLVIDIALWTIVVALGLTLFLRDQPMFSDCAALCPRANSSRCCRASRSA